MNKRELGYQGEAIAVDYLKAYGFKIVERNFRCKLGEIDIIARKRGDIYFVEVKARKGSRFGTPLESITLAKQRQIARIAKFFLLKYKRDCNCHFSAIGIMLDGAGGPEITFLPDAFCA